MRLEFLQSFCDDLNTIPRITFLNKMFNPLGFINSIKQQTCQQEKQPLDMYEIATEIIPDKVEDFLRKNVQSSEIMCYCAGFKIEGASFDMDNLIVEDCKPKIL